MSNGDDVQSSGEPITERVFLEEENCKQLSKDHPDIPGKTETYPEIAFRCVEDI